jgi:predicted enzyme related to lactoylglutathione lyase
LKKRARRNKRGSPNYEFCGQYNVANHGLVLLERNDRLKPVGGLMQCTKEGVPPHWLAYVAVDDAEASARQAAALGATIVVAPKDIPGVGKIAVFVDPQGAALGVFQPEFPPKT